MTKLVPYYFISCSRSITPNKSFTLFSASFFYWANCLQTWSNPNLFFRYGCRFCLTLQFFLFRVLLHYSLSSRETRYHCEITGIWDRNEGCSYCVIQAPHSGCAPRLPTLCKFNDFNCPRVRTKLVGKLSQARISILIQMIAPPYFSRLYTFSPVGFFFYSIDLLPQFRDFAQDITKKIYIYRQCQRFEYCFNWPINLASNICFSGELRKNGY